jgi:hypothetical protein
VRSCSGLQCGLLVSALHVKAGRGVKHGRAQNLRQDGTFEYDDWPEQAQPTYTAGNVVITRKQARLSSDEVKELVSIAEQPDFQTAAETYLYPGPGVPTDVLSKTVVTYIHGGGMKQIVINNYSPRSPSEAYPASLKRLLRRVHELKVKATGKDYLSTYISTLISEGVEGSIA